MRKIKQIFWLLPLMVMFMVNVGWGQTLYDSYSDGNFTSNPVWGGNTTLWQIVANSDAAAGATGSNTLRLSSVAVSQTDYLSSQISSWGVSQEWGFWVGRRAQAFTAANQMYIWLYANESTLNNATVDGYRIAIGDDAGDDNIRLEYILNGAVSATVITSSGTISNGLTDIGFLVRVTRSQTGVWTLYTSTLPTSDGNGAIATVIPNSTNASVNQGSATHNTIVPTTNGYLGVAALHSTGASAIVAVEFDQIYFTPTSTGLTPPSLTADNTDNNVDNNIDITFTDAGSPLWSSQITAVKIGGTALTLTTDYVITLGNIQLKPSGLNTLLTISGSKAVTVEATGYTTASVTQIINPGADNNLLIFTQPTAPAVNGGSLGTQPIVKIRDQYNNTTTSTATVLASVGAGSWTLGGTSSVNGVSGTVTYSGLTATSLASVTGATISFTSSGLTGVTSGTFNIPAPVTLGWQITAPNTLFTIDFDNTVSGVNNGQFAGSGFQPTPTSGRLNSDAWAVTGWSDGDLTFGGTRTTAATDYTRGTSSGGETTGGIYAFTVSTGNRGLGFQPGGSDWAPGTVILKFQNSSGADVTSLLISYKVYIRNDEGRSNSFNFSHSSNNSTYSSVTNLNLTSIAASDAAGWKTYIRTVNITGLTITNGSFYYLRWSGDDVGGSGSRDEFAIDDIQLVANSTSVIPTFAGTIENAVLNGNTNLSGNATINSSLNLISNTLSIGANTLTLNGTVTTTSGTLTGGSNSNIVIGGSGTATLPSITNGLQNLTLNRSTGITLGGALTISGTLTMTSGNITTGANVLTLGTGTSVVGDLVWNSDPISGIIVGKFKRWFASGTTVLRSFPIGTATDLKLVEITPYSFNTGGTILTEFVSGNPGINNPTPLTDFGDYLVDAYSTAGKWVVTPGDGLNIGVSGSYNINITAENILGVNVPAQLRIIKRIASGNSWVLEGNHEVGSGTTIKPVGSRSGLTSFSEFAIAGKFSVNPLDGLLPVELSSFTANINERNVNLNWTTANEQNNAGFEIQRTEIRNQKPDEWVKVTFVTGNGTKNTPTNYSFEDKKLNTGKYNYRLKQIDYNGNFEYFDLKSEVEIGTPKKFEISQNYPNPFNPSTKIDVDLPFDSKVMVKMYDISGREIKTLINEIKQAGYYTVEFNGTNLASGLYFYRIVAEGNGQKYVMTKKAVLIK